MYIEFLHNILPKHISLKNERDHIEPLISSYLTIALIQSHFRETLYVAYKCYYILLIITFVLLKKYKSTAGHQSEITQCIPVGNQAFFETPFVKHIRTFHSVFLKKDTFEGLYSRSKNGIRVFNFPTYFNFRVSGIF